MQGHKKFTPKLFHTINLDNLVPDDHVIRRLQNAIDLEFLYEETAPYYSHDGKPSIDPIILFKFYILAYFFGINSERKLFRETQVNLAYRWFIGYDLDEKIPDHSILTKSRRRLPGRIFERVFKKVLEQCQKEGLISGRTLFMDSSLVRADVSKDSFRKLPEPGKFLSDIEKATVCDRSVFKGKVFDGDLDPNNMGKRRKRQKKNDFFMSPTDRDAQYITRPGKGSFPAYKAHICVDRKHRVITAVDGSKAIDDDISKVHSLYSNTLFSTKQKPKEVVGDSHYGGIESLKYFQDQGIDTCISPRQPDNNEGRFKNEDFLLSEDKKILICPAGNKGSRVNCKKSYRVIFKFKKSLCNSCPLKKECTVSSDGRTVSFYQGDYFDNAISFSQSPRGKKLLRARQIIVEGVIGEAKTNHLLTRCRYRSLEKFLIQLWITATVINLKRLLTQKQGRTTAGAIKVVPTMLFLPLYFILLDYLLQIPDSVSETTENY